MRLIILIILTSEYEQESINHLRLNGVFHWGEGRTNTFIQRLPKCKFPWLLTSFLFFYWGSHVTIWPQWVLRVVPESCGKHECVFRVKTRLLVSCGGERSGDILHLDRAELLFMLQQIKVTFCCCFLSDEFLIYYLYDLSFLGGG